MNIKYIIIGLFFLLNPNINIIDILPDFIGCAFIIRGMMKCSSLNYNFKDSYGYFKRLLWLEIAKMPCLILYFIIGSNDMVWYLLLSFSFGVFEIYFSLMAFSKLFDGIVYSSISPLESSEDDPLTSPVESQKNKAFSLPAKGSVDFVRIITFVFLIAKIVLCVLPDLTLLSTGSYGEVTESGIVAWADYRDLFTIFAFIITLALGIYWFVMLTKYFRDLQKDADYIPALEHDYEKLIEDDPFSVARKKLYFAFTFFILGAVFCLSLTFDGISYLPRALCGVMFALACYSLIPLYQNIAKKAFKLSVIYSIVSFVVWVYDLIFVLSFFKTHLTNTDEGLAASFAEVLDTQINKSFDTLYLFYGSVLLSAVEAVFMILLLVSVAKLLKNIIKDHTGTANGDIFQPVKALNILLYATVISGAIAALCVPVRVALSVLLPDFWLVESLARILFIAIMIILVVKIKEEFKTKYFID